MGVAFLLVVLAFALISVGAEIVFIGLFLSPRMRGKMLGNKVAVRCLHAFILAANLYVHWGSGAAGTNASLLAFIMSPVAMWLSKHIFGYFTHGETFKHGWIKYSAKELLDDEQYELYIITLADKAQHELTKFEKQELELYAQA